MQIWLSKYTTHIKHCYQQEQSRIKQQTHDIRKWTVTLKKKTFHQQKTLRKQVTKIQASLKTFFSNNAQESHLTQEPSAQPAPKIISNPSKKTSTI